MKLLTFKSREEWLNSRAGRIGGSDASAVVGLNPYKDNVTLWMEKTGQAAAEDISEKPYVKYGTVAEDHLRELFKLDFPEYQVFYEPDNMWLNDRFPWAHASLDGWLVDQDGRHGILEIKTTNILQSLHKEKWNQRIPDNYYCQLLHYMAVTEAEFCVLKAQLKSEFSGNLYIQTKHYFMERHELQADIDYLMEKESEFYEFIKKGKQPPLVLPPI